MLPTLLTRKWNLMKSTVKSWLGYYVHFSKAVTSTSGLIFGDKLVDFSITFFLITYLTKYQNLRKAAVYTYFHQGLSSVLVLPLTYISPPDSIRFYLIVCSALAKISALVLLSLISWDIFPPHDVSTYNFIALVLLDVGNAGMKAFSTKFLFDKLLRDEPPENEDIDRVIARTRVWSLAAATASVVVSYQFGGWKFGGWKWRITFVVTATSMGGSLVWFWYGGRPPPAGPASPSKRTRSKSKGTRSKSKGTRSNSKGTRSSSKGTPSSSNGTPSSDTRPTTSCICCICPSINPIYPTTCTNPICPTTNPLCPWICPTTNPICPTTNPICPWICPITNPICPTTNPLSPITNPICPTTNALSPTTNPICPTTNPLSPTTNPICPTTNPLSPTTNPIYPTTNPPSPTTNPLSPTHTARPDIRESHLECPSASDQLPQNDGNQVCLSPQVELLRCLGKAAPIDSGSVNAKELNMIAQNCTAMDVKKCKLLLKMVPLCSTFLLFSLATSTGDAFFPGQGENLMSSNLIVFLVAVRKELDPSMINWFLPKSNQRIELLKIWFGMILSPLCFFIACLVEARRLTITRDNNCPCQPEKTIPMSVFWLAPQFFILGFMDVLAKDGLEKFFFYQFPKWECYTPLLDPFMEGIGDFLGDGIGNFPGIFFLQVSKSSFGKTLNLSHLDNYYLLISILGLVNAVYCSLILRVYHETEEVDVVTEEEGSESEGTIIEFGICIG